MMEDNLETLYKPMIDMETIKMQNKRKEEQIMIEKSDNELTNELFSDNNNNNKKYNKPFINKIQSKNKYYKKQNKSDEKKINKSLPLIPKTPPKNGIYNENWYNDIFGSCKNKDDTYYNLQP